MTSEQIQVLDAGLRMIQDPNFNPITIAVAVRNAINAHYSPADTRTLGRQIVVEAISRTGYFSEA